MVKFIYYLILCGTLFLYCCGDRNKSLTSTNSINDNSQPHKSEKIILQKDSTLTPEEQKFKLLIFAFNKMKNIMEKDFQSLNFTSSRIQVERTYTEFIPWLLNHPDKQKELANSFNSFYNFLDEKRQKYANTKTLNAYIADAINAGKDNHENNKYGAKSENFIWHLFRDTIDSISLKDSKEEKFENIKIQLTSTNMINYYRTTWL
ncbi:Mlp family lipoprotein (plasmid) [Borrelia miyamotoi]|uniref:Mlp family lipoprotein n=2 Tax=Borrelia miyamotoi TaxID=47466 RepID=A0AAQ3HFP8_9SPIR|nr:Mlp family lipoprotein [Borrelia miyamotoi]AHH05769.1 Congo red-binding lipoprotein nlph [Borrelia miyamotoi FR64b]ATQ15342.1 Mlp family lipoprotein [Borrelia miyamotoi]ATQ16526.1 Mlp family lipoprotein [Borrelia miyamotoi]ATQ17672.1 Mlp family lipoprotein [Borrelia miyamotoi]ATQ18876.1 Mlp family lipoprotein [Borrelia miyamotoi]